MEWGLIGVILAVIFFGSTTILAIRLAKRKKPVWACNTTKIVGLGSDAPPQLKLTFGSMSVKDVYQTSLIFFNKRTDIIDKSDVTEKVTIHFKGARILRQPNVKPSNDEVQFSARRVVKRGDNSVELGFLYLAHNDGAVIEVMHTESQGIFPTGNIKGVKITEIKKFNPYEKLPGIVRVIVFSTLTSILLAVIIMHNAFIFRLDPDTMNGLYLFLGMFGFFLISDVIQRIRYRKFPRWSRLQK